MKFRQIFLIYSQKVFQNVHEKKYNKLSNCDLILVNQTSQIYFLRKIHFVFSFKNNILTRSFIAGNKYYPWNTLSIVIHNENKAGPG